MSALCWGEVKDKTAHCQGENSSTYHNMYKEKIIKKKIKNLQMRKTELSGWKVIKQLFNVLHFWVYASFPYTPNWNWLQWISLEKFDFIVHF